MLQTKDLFDFSHSIAGPYLMGFSYPWQALAGIKQLILDLGKQLGSDYTEISPTVWVHKTATIAPTAYLGAPCIIGAGTEVRHCAFIRGSALVLFDNVQVPHYNYVGDSILGYKSHMGAGSLTSNVKSDKTLVVVKAPDEQIPTGLKKFGAMLGDFVEVGCNSVLNPGTVIGPHSNIYPTSCVRGVVPPDSIWKTGGNIVAKRKD